MTTKDKVKKIYNFLKNNCKTYKKKIVLHPELEVTVEYSIYFYEQFQSEIITEKAKFSKTFKEVFELYMDGTVDEYSPDIDYTDHIDPHLEKLQDEFDDLRRDLGDNIDPYKFNYFLDYYFLDYKNWTECWENVREEFGEVESPKSPPIQLTSQYSAIIDKKNKLVKVGCQSIPIENVRKVIEEYDKH